MANSIGEQLKQARERRGMSLEQAAEETRIRVHFLEALESNQRDILPSQVQGRGFLRLYAGMLDLPVGPLLSLWDSPSTPPQEAVAQLAQTENMTETGQGAEGAVLQPDGTHSDRVSGYAPEQTSSAQVYDQSATSSDQARADSSQAIFAEIGQQLRTQRESLGLTMAEVERYTRLRLRYIHALESGQLDELPSPVQGRGMLSNYASFLNMNEQKILLRFADGLQARRIERQPKQESQSFFNQKRRPARQATLIRRFLTPDLLFGVGVAVIILSFALWATARINTLRTTEAEPTPPGIAEVLLTPDGLSQTPAAASTDSLETPGVEPATEGTPAPPGEEVVVGVPVLPSPPAGATPQNTATLPPINSDPLQVYIIARQRAYLKVVTDDRVRFLGRTVPGNAYAFSGNRRIELSTGNSAALQVFFNQTDLGTLGIPGEVTNLVFTSEGYATPTPAFTFTPTPTRQATITPFPSATATVTPTITPLIP